jgi:hypothetical protein
LLYRGVKYRLRERAVTLVENACGVLRGKDPTT